MAEIRVVQHADITRVGQTKNTHESLARKSEVSGPRNRPSSRRENNKKIQDAGSIQLVQGNN
jgi:hypothetical protein